MPPTAMRPTLLKNLCCWAGLPSDFSPSSGGSGNRGYACFDLLPRFLVVIVSAAKDLLLLGGTVTHARRFPRGCDAKARRSSCVQKKGWPCGHPFFCRALTLRPV